MDGSRETHREADAVSTNSYKTDATPVSIDVSSSQTDAVATLSENPINKTEAKSRIPENLNNNGAIPKPIEEGNNNNGAIPKPIEEGNNKISAVPKPIEEGNNKISAVPKPIEEGNNKISAVPKPIEEGNNKISAVPKPIEEGNNKISAIPKSSEGSNNKTDAVPIPCDYPSKNIQATPILKDVPSYNTSANLLPKADLSKESSLSSHHGDPSYKQPDTSYNVPEIKSLSLFPNCSQVNIGVNMSSYGNYNVTNICSPEHMRQNREMCEDDFSRYFKSNRKLSEKDLNTIAKYLGNDWKRVGRCLKIKNDELGIIEANNPKDVKEQSFIMLSKWLSSSKPEACTSGNLCKALYEADCHNAIKYVPLDD